MIVVRNRKSGTRHVLLNGILLEVAVSIVKSPVVMVNLDRYCLRNNNALAHVRRIFIAAADLRSPTLREGGVSEFR